MTLSAIRHALDRFYFLSFSVQTQHQTRKDRASVYEDGTRTTLAKFAAVFGPHQTEIFAQNFEQSLVGRKRHLRRFAVQDKLDVRFFLLRFLFFNQPVHLRSANLPGSGIKLFEISGPMDHSQDFNKLALDAIDYSISLQQKLANVFVIRLRHDTSNLGMGNESFGR